jgi:hypothetical protein
MKDLDSHQSLTASANFCRVPGRELWRRHFCANAVPVMSFMNPIYLWEIEHEVARQRCEPNVHTILDYETDHHDDDRV